MADTSLKNKETDKDVLGVINAIENETKREDSKQLLELFSEVTGKKAKVWGKNYIGFGKYTYSRKGSKQEHEWFSTGFAAQKAKLTIYVGFYLAEEEKLLSKLGKFKTGKGCIYINRLEDVDTEVLKEIIFKSKDAKWGND